MKTKSAGIDEKLSQSVEGLIRGLAKLLKIATLLNPLEEEIMCMLKDARSGCQSVETLRTTLKLSADSMSYALRCLENYRYNKQKIQLIRRKLCDDDRRRHVVEITSDGKDILKLNSENRSKRLGILFGALSVDEKNVLWEMIGKMRNSLVDQPDCLEK